MHTCDLLLLAAWFMSAQGVKVTRGGPVDVTRLTHMINTVYKKGEEGIISDTAERPFYRFMESDVQGLLDSDALLLARSSDADSDADSAGEVVGCVKLDLGVSQDGLPAGERVGEWGGLAVGEAHQGRGVASALVSAAEAELRTAGCTLAQLELLTPAHWKHGRRFERAPGDGHYACPTAPAFRRRHAARVRAPLRRGLPLSLRFLPPGTITRSACARGTSRVSATACRCRATTWPRRRSCRAARSCSAASSWPWRATSQSTAAGYPLLKNCQLLRN